LVAGGAAVVGLGLGTYFLIKTDKTLDERDGICPTSNNCEPGTNRRLAGLTSDARSQQRAEVVFFALAGASAALAAGLWFWPGPEASDRHTYVAPALSPRAAGLVLGGQL
jgi:serine/threonine-protein kinase